MSNPSHPSAAGETRAQRVEALLNQLRPMLEATARELIERAIDVPEAEEFGAIDLEFRDAGLRLANEVRQAALAGRKKTRPAILTGIGSNLRRIVAVNGRPPAGYQGGLRPGQSGLPA